VPLTVFNGSPRGPTGNTRLLMDQFLAGHAAAGGEAGPVRYLFKRNELPENVDAFRRARTVVLAFPLYVHAMPGIVKHFIDALAPRDPADGVTMGFIVQSGFPEAHHSRWLERYLERLPAKLHCRYVGTVIKGGGEGVHVMPAWMNRRLFARFRKLGERFARTGSWDPGLLKELGTPEDLPGWQMQLLRLVDRLGLANLYWDSNLRKNHAYEKRFDRPYESMDPWA
jgi:NAD(P)H-dependent FMN reductase